MIGAHHHKAYQTNDLNTECIDELPTSMVGSWQFLGIEGAYNFVAGLG